MAKVFEDDILTLYCGDYRTIINDLNFNYIITDPPYNKNYKYLDYKDNLKFNDYIDLIKPLNKYKLIMIHYPEMLFNLCGTLTNLKKTVFWCYNTNLNRQSRIIGFFKCSPDFSKVRVPYKDYKDKRIQELVKKGSKGAKIYDWWADIGLVKNSSHEKVKGFSNQIPVKLLERIILLTTNENDIILDPFFGTGSLYFACKNTKRRCIGIEKSEEHINKFYERLNKITS